MVHERIAKYEAWIRELEARAADLASHRSGYLRLFAAPLAASLLGFVWNAWIGAACVLTALMVYVFGYYVVAIRQQDYARELADARREVARLRAAHHA